MWGFGIWEYGKWCPHRTTEHVVPVLSRLKQLSIAHDLTPETIPHLPQSSGMTQLMISKIFLSSSLGISSFTSHYPKLSVLSLSLSLKMVFVVQEATAYVQSLDPIYPNLKQISVMHDGKVGLNMQTTFPSLEESSFSPVISSPVVITMVTTLSLSSPKLTELTICDLPEFNLDMSSCPKLHRLTATHCLDIDTADLPSLYLDGQGIDPDRHALGGFGHEFVIFEG